MRREPRSQKRRVGQCQSTWPIVNSSGWHFALPPAGWLSVSWSASCQTGSRPWCWWRCSSLPPSGPAHSCGSGWLNLFLFRGARLFLFFGGFVVFQVWLGIVAGVSIGTRYWASTEPSYHFGVTIAIGVIPLLVLAWLLG